MLWVQWWRAVVLLKTVVTVAVVDVAVGIVLAVV